MDPLTELMILSREELKARGIEHTPREISQQPSLWIKNFEMLKNRVDEIKVFIEKNILSKNIGRILLSGAGSSHFIGLSCENLLRRMWQVNIESKASTDIVTDWKSIFLTNLDTTVIYFSRSGNSPEVLGAFLLADKYHKKINHIVVTCNKSGKLASLRSKNEKENQESNVLRIILSEETNDKGLAMTSSFTTMLMAAQFLAHVHEIDRYEETIRNASKIAKKILKEDSSLIKEIAELDFERAFFLGSGSLYGCAAEAHLKLQELTAGHIICKFDSFLGVRHGPEAAINNKTLIICFVSSNPFTRRYEIDFIKDMYEKALGLKKIAICCGLDEELKRYVDYVIDISDCGNYMIQDSCRPIVDVIVGQLLGLFKSLNLGLKPDNPSEKGVITRVVRGVKIYDYEEYERLKQFKVIVQ